MRTILVAGNWKMHKSLDEALAFCAEVKSAAPANCILIPPFPLIAAMADALKGSHVSVGAQNCHTEVQGAFTGEVSPEILRSCGARWIVVGHSERREYFGETDALLARKTDAVLRAGLRPIFCVGEKLDVRERNQHFELVGQQLRDGLFHLPEAAFREVVIAYEPVWAIGTGVTASPAQAQEMHAFLRNRIAEHYGAAVADDTLIQYGGSVKPDNAAELFAQPDVDGGLVGGASLKPADFLAIVAAGA